MASLANSGNAQAAVKLLCLTAALEPPVAHGYARLRVQPLQAEEDRKFPTVPRSLASVPEDLCDLFGRLCAGLEPWPLFVFGPAGTGKTYSALAFGDLVRGKYRTLEDLCDGVMGGERRANLAAGTMLIVDEIGERSRATDLVYLTLKSVLDHREFHHNRVAIYLSNLPPSELVGMFDDRVVSRLTAGTVYKLSGNDRRHPRQ